MNRLEQVRKRAKMQALNKARKWLNGSRHLIFQVSFCYFCCTLATYFLNFLCRYFLFSSLLILSILSTLTMHNNKVCLYSFFDFFSPCQISIWTNYKSRQSMVARLAETARLICLALKGEVKWLGNSVKAWSEISRETNFTVTWWYMLFQGVKVVLKCLTHIISFQ